MIIDFLLSFISLRDSTSSLVLLFFACPSTTSNDREGRRGVNDSNGSKYSEKIIELRENYNLKCKQFGMVLQWGHPTGLLGGLL